MFEGLSVALVTPFKDGAVDEPGVERLVDFVVAGGTDVLVVAGSTGEAVTLTREERRRLRRGQVRERRPRPARRRHRHERHPRLDRAHRGGARSATTAHAGRALLQQPTPAGQYAHFTAVARAVEMPLMVYNVPGRTGTNMLPDTVVRIAQLDTVVAIKEASGSLDQVSAIRARTNLTILSGDDSLTLPMLAIGARGVVSVLGNVAPRPLKDLLIAFDEGRLLDAERLHKELTPLMRALFVESNPGPVKSLLADMGLIANELRLPLVPVEPETAKLVRHAAKSAGVTIKDTVGAAR
jgi:4-hydroxy-tetrahydrodipicolinate synthase